MTCWVQAASIAYWTYCDKRCSYEYVFNWLIGYAGDLWSNGERYGVGLNRNHVGKCLWVFDWHHYIWP